MQVNYIIRKVLRKGYYKIIFIYFFCRKKCYWQTFSLIDKFGRVIKKISENNNKRNKKIR